MPFMLLREQHDQPLALYSLNAKFSYEKVALETMRASKQKYRPENLEPALGEYLIVPALR